MVLSIRLTRFSTAKVVTFIDYLDYKPFDFFVTKIVLIGMAVSIRYERIMSRLVRVFFENSIGY